MAIETLGSALDLSPELFIRHIWRGNGSANPQIGHQAPFQPIYGLGTDHVSTFDSEVSVVPSSCPSFGTNHTQFGTLVLENPVKINYYPYRPEHPP